MSRISAGDAGFDQHIQKLSESVQARFRYHSIELPDGSILPGLQTIEHLRWRLGLFGLPEDLRGRRVLDVGAWDGWFSFECERRGAEVVAVDCVELDTFLEARDLLGSKVEYLTLDVNELSAQRLGRFDIVLFFGVLYHLRHPLLGLEKALELSTGIVLVESFVIEAEERPVPAVMEFYERAELGGQVDNWCGPSPECLLAMCRSAGFAQVEMRDITSQRASVLCNRRWPEPGRCPDAAPHLHSAVNNRSYAAIFHPVKDEYICCYFKFVAAGTPGPDQVRIEVDGFGVPSISVTSNGLDGWQANCVRPPGLAPGRHQVRLRVGDSAVSNSVEFSMLDETGRLTIDALRDFPGGAPELCSAEYRPSGDRRLSSHGAGSLICYFRSPASLIGVPDVEISVGNTPVRPRAVGSLGGGIWQADVSLAQPAGESDPVKLRLGTGSWSNVVPCGYSTT